MEHLVSPKCEEIFDVVDDHKYLNEYLAEVWEIIETHFYSSEVRDIDGNWKYEKLIKS